MIARPISFSLSGGLALGLCLLVAGGLLWGQAAQEKQSEMTALGKLVPLGHVSTGVRVPSFDDDGRLSTLIEAASVTRIDDERLSADKVEVQIIAEQPEMNVRVSLPTAVYHMNEQTLRSGDRSRVSRKDFQVEGDALVFDSASSVGKMTGRVRTIIFDTEAFSGQTNAPQSAPETSQASPQPKQ